MASVCGCSAVRAQSLCSSLSSVAPASALGCSSFARGCFDLCEYLSQRPRKVALVSARGLLRSPRVVASESARGWLDSACGAGAGAGVARARMHQRPRAVAPASTRGHIWLL